MAIDQDILIAGSKTADGSIKLSNVNSKYVLVINELEILW